MHERWLSSLSGCVDPDVMLRTLREPMLAERVQL